MKRRTELSRRRFLASAFGATGALALGGCDALSQTEWAPKILEAGEKLSSVAQHLIAPRRAMAQEFSEADLSPRFRSNGTSMPANPQYLALATGGFADYRLAVDGLVEKPASLSLAELRALPSRTQITRHDCVEGWSAIGKWKGARLSALLEAVQPKPQARFVVFHCADPKRDARACTTRASTWRMRFIRRRSSPTTSTTARCRYRTAPRCVFAWNDRLATSTRSMSCASSSSRASRRSAAARVVIGKIKATNGGPASSGRRESGPQVNFEPLRSDKWIKVALLTAA